MSGKLTEFAEKLIKFSNVATEDEVYSTLIKAINVKLKKVGFTDGKKVIQDIRYEVETHYNLKKKSLINSFCFKDRELTEPKLVWVMVCLFIFDGDRKLVENLIGNGITYQKVYTCHKEFSHLSDKIPHERKTKEIYNLIIKSHG